MGLRDAVLVRWIVRLTLLRPERPLPRDSALELVAYFGGIAFLERIRTTADQ
jgi:hypothetical protein